RARSLVNTCKSPFKKHLKIQSSKQKYRRYYLKLRKNKAKVDKNKRVKEDNKGNKDQEEVQAVAGKVAEVRVNIDFANLFQPNKKAKESDLSFRGEAQSLSFFTNINLQVVQRLLMQ